MKKIIFVMLLVCSAVISIAQPVASGGSFSSGYNPYYTSTRSVSSGSHDTAIFVIAGTLNSASLQVYLLKTGGRTDTGTITIEGSCEAGTAANFVTLTSYTPAQSTSVQNWIYLFNSGSGMPYRTIRIRYDPLNAAAGSAANVKYSLLVR